MSPLKLYQPYCFVVAITVSSLWPAVMIVEEVTVVVVKVETGTVNVSENGRTHQNK